MRAHLLLQILAISAVSGLVLTYQACSAGFMPTETFKANLAVEDLSSNVEGKALYTKNCAACHGSIDTSNKKGATVADITRGFDTEKSMAIFKKVLSPAEVSAISKALAKPAIAHEMCDAAPDVGRVAIHRLNNSEYDNTVKDLLGITTNMSSALTFPADSYTVNFANNAQVYGVTGTMMNKYLQAAESALGQAFANGTLKTRLLNCQANQVACLQTTFTNFLYKAFRRPATSDEINRYVKIAQAIQSSGDSADNSVKAAMTAAMVSPNFLYRNISSPQPNNPKYVVNLNQYELASRLSYFIWSSMPDDELLNAAKAGSLTTPSVLQAQTKRMLANAKASALVDNFAAQWMLLREFDHANPDTNVFKGFNASIKADMKTEMTRMFQDIFTQDKSFFELLNSNETYLNQNLATFYGISGVTGAEFRKVSLQGTDRVGILGQGALLTLNANPDSTSIVKRGKWVLENLLCTPPPPAPPDAGGLPGNSNGKTMREIMETHRANPACYSCHAQMDPIGFSLENYDGVGRYRTMDGNNQVDSRGTFPDGRSFSGVRQLASIISQDEKFKTCVAEKLFSYSLGREPETFDHCTINRIGLKHIDPSKPVSEAIIQMVLSDSFRKQRGEGVN